MKDEKKAKEGPVEPAWQSDRSEAWGRGDKDMNPRPAGSQNKHPTERRQEGGDDEVRTQPGDTPAMIAKRREIQKRGNAGQSLVGTDPSDGFKMDDEPQA